LEAYVAPQGPRQPSWSPVSHSFSSTGGRPLKNPRQERSALAHDRGDDFLVSMAFRDRSMSATSKPSAVGGQI